ncbi:DUF427 domain-containing protein [Williamsia sp. M5A3_1d]
MTVRVGDTVVARTDSALTLREAGYPAVQYVPVGDVDSSVLRESDTHTWCPYKGEASYRDLVVEGRELPDTVWFYPHPHDAVAEVADHVAFYADRVDITVGG